MYKLAILSRDAEHYRREIECTALTDLAIIYCNNQIQDEQELAHADILLAEPDLAAQALPFCQELKWLQSTWAGVKPLMKGGALPFKLTGIKDIFGKQMREYAFAYMLHYARDIEGFKALKSALTWQPLPTSSLYGKTLGIMGVGSIGKDVARAAKAFDMRTYGLTASSKDCEFIDSYFHMEQKLDFASELDYVLCLLPHTLDTENLIDGALLDALPEHCVLINAGRGQVINETALIEALNTKQIRAAVLDVFTTEPLPKDHPFWATKNLHITHHTAAVSLVADILSVFYQNFERFRNNTALNYIVDPQKGY